jgi:hypothetical protein
MVMPRKRGSGMEKEAWRPLMALQQRGEVGKGLRRG